MDLGAVAAGLGEALVERFATLGEHPLGAVNGMIDEPVAELAGEPRQAALVGREPDRYLVAHRRRERTCEGRPVVFVVRAVEAVELAGMALLDDQADHLDRLSHVLHRFAVTRHTVEPFDPGANRRPEAECQPAVREPVEIERCHRDLERARDEGVLDAGRQRDTLGDRRDKSEPHERRAVDLWDEDPRHSETLYLSSLMT